MLAELGSGPSLLNPLWYVGSYAIGATLGLTGPIAGVATPYRDGINAYFSFVNGQGGIGGHKIKFTALDDATNVTTGVANCADSLFSALFGHIGDDHACTFARENDRRRSADSRRRAGYQRALASE